MATQESQRGSDIMNTEQQKQKILLRTFDLPDIYFMSVAGLEGGGHTFSADRPVDEKGIDSVALDRWYEQSRLAADAQARRDCWLQVDGRIYVIWGASIKARSDVNNGGGSHERWEFSFDEMRRYRPTPGKQ
jgi:hypothetical protein